MKKYCSKEELIEKLERKGNIEFSPSTIKLLDSIGYERLKKIIDFMLDNDLIINNRSIISIYKNEKHLRHMLMPRIETFEMTLKNHTLSIITSIVGNDDVINAGYSVFTNLRRIKTINSLNRKKEFLSLSVESNNISIFDWFNKLMFCELISFFDNLKANIKIDIIKKAFDITINLRVIKKDLDQIRF